MIRFNCDYLEGTHPRILERLVETNMEQTVGYGEDEYCQKAAQEIKRHCGDETVAVHFFVGGTQTNLTVIASALRPYEGVLTAETGHINCHETGAIEATGHKVLALPSADGKLTAQQIFEAVDHHKNDESYEHIVKPKMVYISHPTEVGTIYTKEELKAIHKVCEENGLYLFLDGARLGYGLCCVESDLDLPTITKYCDVFYIGGTKVGALFGEAVVIRREELKKEFRFSIKQKGGMLAKGRLLGVQFLTLFEENLYFEISKHAANMAEKLKAGFSNLGCEFYLESPTNQQFIIVPNEILEPLSQNYGFDTIDKLNNGTSVIRFCTSWATKEENIDALLCDMKKYL